MKRIILAIGEATGHSHVIESDDAELIETDTGKTLNITADGVELAHPEHGVVIIPQKEGYNIGQVEEINWPLKTIQKIQD